MKIAVVISVLMLLLAAPVSVSRAVDDMDSLEVAQQEEQVEQMEEQLNDIRNSSSDRKKDTMDLYEEGNQPPEAMPEDDM